MRLILFFYAHVSRREILNIRREFSVSFSVFSFGPLVAERAPRPLAAPPFQRRGAAPSPPFSPRAPALKKARAVYFGRGSERGARAGHRGGGAANTFSTPAAL